MAIQEPFSAKWKIDMSLVEKVKVICREQMEEIAKTIEGELKAEAIGKRAHVRTGMAQASIHIEQKGETSYRIGAIATFPPDGNDGGTHLYYLDQGNGGSGRTIRSKREFDRRGIPPGKLALKDGSYRTAVSGYSGTHFIAKVANRHR